MDRNNRMICYRRNSDFTVGEKGTDIQIPEFHYKFLVAETQLIFCEKNFWAESQIRVNGKYFKEDEYSLNSGDKLEIGKYTFVFLEERIMIFGENISDITANLLEIAADTDVSEEFPHYKRSPRIVKRISDKTIQLSQPKEMQEQKKGGLAALILPPIAMLCVTVGVSILMKRGVFVLMSVAGTAVTLITSVVKYVTDKKEYKEEQKERKELYREYLLRKQKEIYQAYQNEKDAYQYNYPDVQELNTMIHLFDERIYERSVNDEDFLSVSLGKAYVPCQFKIQMNAENIHKKEDELGKDAIALVQDFSNIWKPVVVDLKKAHLGLVGEKDVIHSKDKTSSLEFTMGIKSKLLKRITLLLCKEYSETTNKLVVENFEDGKIIFHSDDVECSVFKTILYSNGARIILSDKKSSHYIKMDKVYLGLSDTDDIIEICVCDMSVSELEHLKKELELQ